MPIKRLKANKCGLQLPGGLTGVGKGMRSVEPKNKINTNPPNKGERNIRKKD